MMSVETSLWVERYRPKTVNDVILPARLKQPFLDMIKNGDMPHMILAGPPGTGKTTIARALCHDLGYDFIMINGSDDRNIDTLRDRVRGYASTVSVLDTGKKVIFFDEADYLNPKSTQPALRGFIEEFSETCRFIFTCNYKSKLIEPLHSRCAFFEFSMTKDEIADCAGEFFVSLTSILEENKITYDQAAVAQVISKHMPDWRRILNETQRYAASGSIDAGILRDMDEESFGKLVGFLAAKDFKGMRKWVVDNSDVDPTRVYRQLYDSMDKRVDKKSQPGLILALADYSYRSAFVADQEICLVACLTEIMRDVTFNA